LRLAVWHGLKTQRSRSSWKPLNGGDLATVVEFLDSGMDVNAGDAINTTALMMSVWGGHPSAIRVLLDRGASLSPQNSLGHTAVTIALRRSQPREEYRGGSDPTPLEMLLAAGRGTDSARSSC
jgi:hypothetical protein